MLYLKPILPELAKQTECFLKIAPLTWADHQTVLTDHRIEIFQPLMQRIDPANIEKCSRMLKQMNKAICRKIFETFEKITPPPKSN